MQWTPSATGQSSSTGDTSTPRRRSRSRPIGVLDGRRVAPRTSSLGGTLRLARNGLSGSPLQGPGRVTSQKVGDWGNRHDALRLGGQLLIDGCEPVGLELRGVGHDVAEYSLNAGPEVCVRRGCAVGRSSTSRRTLAPRSNSPGRTVSRRMLGPTGPGHHSRRRGTRHSGSALTEWPRSGPDRPCISKLSRRRVEVWSAESSSAVEDEAIPSRCLSGDEEAFEHLSHFRQLIMGLKAARIW